MTQPQPSLEAVRELASANADAQLTTCIPVFCSLPADLLTPVTAYLRLTNGARTGESFLIESVLRGETTGRYSWVGARECLR